jgi:16S rRNA (adenine1518-N6/adenine1519-N6)-dimethyltransferase
MPQPKVTSAVVMLKIRKERPWEILDQATFFRTVKASFAMRRKKLQNGLAAGFPELGKEGAGQVIASCGLPENVRGETLDIAQFAALSNEIFRRKNIG